MQEASKQTIGEKLHGADQKAAQASTAAVADVAAKVETALPVVEGKPTGPVLVDSKAATS